MANKMISEKDLHDDFLSKMIRSDRSADLPPDFVAGIMNRVGFLSSSSILEPYKAPVWIKWGIPGAILSILMVILVWGPDQEPVTSGQGEQLISGVFKQINYWFAGLNIDIQMPALHVSGTLMWILAGGMVLTWSFILLARFLNKRVRH